jgi:outer membrane protein assembly factor BamD
MAYMVKIRLLVSVSAFLGVFIISSCSFLKADFIPESPKEILAEGIKALKNEDTIHARTLLNQIIEDFPGSKERIESLLLLGRTHYSLAEYKEAKNKFQEFIDLYPVNKQADRAYFFKAMSDYKMMDIAARDQTAAQEAIDGFEQLIKRFPKSQYTEKAKKNKKQCELRLAENMFEIGKFYYHTGSYQSAIPRLKNLLAQNPNHKFSDEAAFLLAESYYNEQNFIEAVVFYKKFVNKYPRSQFVVQAKKRLQVLRRY